MATVAAILIASRIADLFIDNYPSMAYDFYDFGYTSSRENTLNDEYMNDKLSEELLESVREGGAILRGEQEASRTFVVETPDVKQIRERYQLSQKFFAMITTDLEM